MASDESESTKSIDIENDVAWCKLAGCGGYSLDRDGAFRLLEERVKEGDAEAMWMSGLCYEYGMGTEQDFEQAELLYKKSRSKGSVVGKYFAGTRGYGRENEVLRWIGL